MNHVKHINHNDDENNFISKLIITKINRNKITNNNICN